MTSPNEKILEAYEAMKVTKPRGQGRTIEDFRDWRWNVCVEIGKIVGMRPHQVKKVICHKVGDSE